MKTINNLWFDNDRIFIETLNGEKLSQPMRFFPRLNMATESQRKKWTESPFGLHWNKLDEDISFESFRWADNDKSYVYQH
ncbi:MAG: DUF2442 domain-containing protein [Prevotellaceae bacterium]|jgi:hypothetical protein|nr:DUF2442 domain-containing protein [Prevotellaceae bacterium]